MNDMFSSAVLLSAHPIYCKGIFDRSKSVELRKSKPNLDPPFKLFVYCTKPSKRHQTISGCMVINTDELFRLPDGTLKHDWSGELMTLPYETWGPDSFLNGKVIGEVICDRITEFQVFEDGIVQNWNWAELDKSCLTYEEVAAYIGIGKSGYAWHLSEPVLYDKPKPISMFHKPCLFSLFCESCGMFNVYPEPGFCGNASLQIKRPPQSWCYVEYQGETCA